MRRQWLRLMVAVSFLAPVDSVHAQAPSVGASRLNADVFAGLTVRSIGPTFVTGRIADIEMDPLNPNAWYIASAFGGLWKTTNRGITFQPIFDDGGSFTLCCVVVDAKDVVVVLAGLRHREALRHLRRRCHGGR